MNEKISKEIIKKLTYISGLSGFSSSDFSKSNKELPKEKWGDCLRIEDTPKGILVSVSIITISEVSVKTIAKEVNSLVKSTIKDNGIKLNKFNLYIRGIK